jgi:hypothetical protein
MLAFLPPPVQFWSALAAAALLLPSTGYSQEAAPAPILWQGLGHGMTPEEVAPIVAAMEGIKRVKVVTPGRSDPSRRLSISYTREQITIAGLSFKLEPRFTGGRLQQVWLMSPNQCANDLIATHGAIAAGLISKYPQVIAGSTALTQVEVAKAGLESADSGKRVQLISTFGGSDIVVQLVVQIAIERPPAYPTVPTNFAVALWQLAKNQYDLRRAECGGKGDGRMDVALQYMSRKEFDAAANQMRQDQNSERARIRDKL